MVSVPFPGSKRRVYKTVRKVFEDGGYSSVYEPFGGSCVLSANLVNDGLVEPERAVVNDFDRFFDDYGEYLDLKDMVVEKGYDYGLKKTTHLPMKGKYVEIARDGSREIVDSQLLQGEDRRFLQELFKNEVPERYWRYFTYGNNFTHSAVCTHKKIKLSDFCLFSRELRTVKQREFLKVLGTMVVEHLDWHDFYKKHKTGIGKTSLLILDPPYTGTAQWQYKGHFDDAATVELLDETNKLGCDYLFFNHDMDKVRDWLKDRDCSLSLVGTKESTANKNRSDVMAYVRVA